MEPQDIAAAGTTTTTASSSGSVYDEQLFISLLTHINTSEARIEALARLALRHLPLAAETWSAIRKAFVLAAGPQSLSELDGPRNRALWCLVDALLKHAPHVYGPLLCPRLLEYVAQQTPLQLMSSAATAASTRLLFGVDGSETTGAGGLWDAEGEAQRAAAWRWWETLILSWEPFLPADVFAAVRHYVTQHKSMAELDGALAHAAAAAAEGGSAAQRQATPADMQQLREDFEALRYLCANSSATLPRGTGVVGAGGPYGAYAFEDLLAAFLAEAAKDGGAAAEPTAAAAATEPQRPAEGRQRPAKSARGDSGSGTSESEADGEGEEEYVPQFIEGAKPRQLPDRGLPAQRRRREGRRRPRDEDY